LGLKCRASFDLNLVSLNQEMVVITKASPATHVQFHASSRLLRADKAARLACKKLGRGLSKMNYLSVE